MLSSCLPSCLGMKKKRIRAIFQHGHNDKKNGNVTLFTHHHFIFWCHEWEHFEDPKIDRCHASRLVRRCGTWKNILYLSFYIRWSSGGCLWVGRVVRWINPMEALHPSAISISIICTDFWLILHSSSPTTSSMSRNPSYCFHNRIILQLVILTTSLISLPINSTAFVLVVVTATSNPTKNTIIKSRMTLGLAEKPESTTASSSESITQEFHQLASEAVDLSNAHVSEAGTLSSK